MFVVVVTLVFALLHLAFALSLLVGTKEDSAKSLVIVLFLFFLYSLGSATEILFGSVFFLQLQFFAIALLPFATLNFVQSYYRVRVSLRRFVSGLTLGLGLIFIALHLLHPFSSLVSPVQPFAGFDATALFNLHAIYQIVAAILGLVAIIPTLFWGSASYRRQGLLLLLSVIIPLLFALSILVTERAMPVNYIPLSLVIPTIILIYLSRKGQLFKGAPLAIQLAFEAMEDGLLVLDQHQRIIDFSPLARLYMPQLDDSVIGLSLSVAAERIELLSAYIRQDPEQEPVVSIISEQGKPVFYEIREVTHGVKAKYHELSMLLIREVTDRHALVQTLEQTNKKLVETNRLQNMVIRVMAHDLRSPLVAMKAMKEIFDPHRKEQRLDLWQSASDELDDLIDRSDGLINNLMMLAGDMESFELAPIDNDILLRYVPPALTRAAQKKAIGLEHRVDEKVLIMANRHLLGNAVRNIIENSIKFSEYGQTVLMTIEVGETDVFFIIEDEGIGIDDAALAAFKEGRWGVSRMGTAGEKGSGLGLFAARQFMTCQGGSLQMERREVRGTRAVLRIPRARR